MPHPKNRAVQFDPEMVGLSASEHLREALILLWRNECTWAAKCGEESLHAVLTHVLAALREVGGDEAVVGAMLDAERVRELCGRSERSPG